MSKKALSGQPFDRDPSGSRGAADADPALAAHRAEVSRPSPTVWNRRRPSGERRALVERIGMAPDDDIEFEPVRLDLFPPPCRSVRLMCVPDTNVVGFRLDEHGDWIARLDCGHERHVRHDPPWSNRPWVVTADGRAAAIGRPLRCSRCAPHSVSPSSV